MDALWRYTAPDPDDHSPPIRLFPGRFGLGTASKPAPGTWELITGHPFDRVSQLIQEITSGYPVYGPMPNEVLHEAAQTCNNRWAATMHVVEPIDPCDEVWPVSSVSGLFVSFEASRCPPARAKAAAWTGGSFGGGFLFGGTTHWDPQLSFSDTLNYPFNYLATDYPAVEYVPLQGISPTAVHCFDLLSLGLTIP